MRYYSTNDRTYQVSFQDAVLSGLAPDGGLYMPTEIPALTAQVLGKLSKLTLQELGVEIVKLFARDELSRELIGELIAKSITFPAPLVQLSEKIYALELFHGPTLAFKDFGAAFMARLLGYYANQSGKEYCVLVATSGDTGSAVAHGFLNVPGIRVVILYPSKKVSKLQELQFTTLGGNITALEVQGSFDDCQNLVKRAFVDPDLKQLSLCSANSINIARLIPQIFYYASALGQLDNPTNVYVSVPSGNFGNLTAGLLGKLMGLPITRFVAATNQNSVVPEYLESGVFSPRASLPTLSNAMDVGNPSNFARIFALFDGDLKRIQTEIFGAHFTDQETVTEIGRVYEQKGYLLDPHGAVGLLGLERLLAGLKSDGTGIFLETAHPAKFLEATKRAIGREPELPKSLARCLTGKKLSELLAPEYASFKDFLLSKL